MASRKEQTIWLVRNMLARLGYKDAQVSITAEGNTVRVEANIDQDAGMLIGKKGETLRALQHLLLLLVSKNLDIRFGPGEFVFDVNNYQRERENQIIALAKNTAYQVREQKMPQELSAMPAVERRLVHITLQKESGVTTQSVGEKDERRVVVSPTQ